MRKHLEGKKEQATANEKTGRHEPNHLPRSMLHAKHIGAGGRMRRAFQPRSLKVCRTRQRKGIAKARGGARPIRVIDDESQALLDHIADLISTSRILLD
jgi:hypothetical protein